MGIRGGRNLKGWAWQAAAGVLLLTGCHAEHQQSVLHPASSAAAQIAWLWWFLLAICTFVFVVVLVLTWLAVRPQRDRSETAVQDFVEEHGTTRGVSEQHDGAPVPPAGHSRSLSQADERAEETDQREVHETDARVHQLSAGSVSDAGVNPSGVRRVEPHRGYGDSPGQSRLVGDVREAALGDRFILWLGAIIPAGLLFVILLVSVGTQKSLAQPETALTIEVVGHQFWWEVHYPEQDFEIANEIRIPVGEPVRLELLSADVTHSLWIPNLQGKTDLLPDRVNVTWIQADQPGVYRGQCAEYCGIQHALMALHVVAVPREEFDAWVAERTRPFVLPPGELAERGREVFIRANCNNCHTVGDDRAARKRGPDLTHMGDRRTVGAGIVPNNRGNLAGWISNPQAMKPGNLMPRTHLEADDLHALVEFLEQLK